MVKQTEIVELYDGAHTIVYDDAAHVYRHQEKDARINGVTSITGIMDKSQFLVPWAAKIGAQSYSAAVRAWLEAQQELPGAVTWRSYFEAVPGFEALAAKAWMVTRDKAGDVGTIAHDYAQSLLDPEDAHRTPPDVSEKEAAKAVKAVDKFFAENVLEAVLVERILFSPKHWFAGRCDWIGHLNSGPLAVNDYKVTKAFFKGKPYLSYAVQFAGYAIAFEEEFGEPINEANLIRLDRKTGKPHIHNIKMTKDLKDAFLFCRGLEQVISRIKKDGEVG